MASKRSRIPLVLVFVLSLAAVGALLTSVAADRWVTAVALRQNLTVSEPPQVPDENGLIPVFTGFIQFGLYKGEKIFNFAFAQRDPVAFSIFSEHKDIYSMGYPIATFALVLLAAVFALVSAVFGLVNTLTVPIETINGPMGLYLWNAIAFVSSLVVWVLYLVLVLTTLNENVLSQEDIEPPNNFFTSSASFGYCYWLVVGSCGAFVVNILCITLAKRLADPDFMQQHKRKHDLSKGENNVALDDIMY